MTSATLASFVSTTALTVLCGSAIAAPDGDRWQERPVYRMDHCNVSVYGRSTLYWGATDETFSDTYSFSTYQGANHAEPFGDSFLTGNMNFHYGNEWTMAQSHSWAQSRLIPGGFLLELYSQMKAQAYDHGGSATAYTDASAVVWAHFEVLTPTRLSIITESDGHHQGNNDYYNTAPISCYRALYKQGPNGAEFLFQEWAHDQLGEELRDGATSHFAPLGTLELEPGVYVLKVMANAHDQTRYADELINSQGWAYLRMDLLFDHVEEPADLTGDGEVDGADMTQLLAAWGGDDPQADLDFSGLVDGGDLVVLLAAWD